MDSLVDTTGAVPQYPIEHLGVCPLCAAAGARAIFSRPDAHLGTLNLHQCPSCDVVYLDPRLAPEGTAAAEDESEIYELTGEEIDQRLEMFSDILRSVAPHVVPHPRMLDVGCNRGLMSEAARRLGWTPVGVDISVVAIERARRDFALRVFTGTVDAVPKTARFDLAMCWHVLEHTHDPRPVLRAVRRRLVNGGVVAIQVPSYAFRDEYQSRGQIDGLVCSVHNFYFTPETLVRLLSSEGLTPIALGHADSDLMITVVAKASEQPQSSLMRFLRETLTRTIRRIAPARLLG